MAERDVVQVWFRDPAATRELVREVVGAQPAALSARPGGKPHLPGTQAPEFSVSRSGGVAAVALGPAGVGIDVERVREVARAQRIAERWLPEADARAVAAARIDDRSLIFLRAWVAAEALVKGWGGGIGDLARLRGSVRALHGGRRAAIAPDGSEWTAAPVPAPAGYVAAVAAPGRGWTAVVN